MINYQQQNPYGYNAPAMPYFPDFRPVQPAQQQQTNNVSWIYVNGVEGAKSQIVQPNQTAWMMDNSEPIIYVKAVDAVGSATLKIFRLTEIGAPATPAKDPDVYATKTDLAGLSDRLKTIEDMIGGINT